MTEEALAAAVEVLEGKSPKEILTWAAAEFGGKLGFSTGFGVEGCVIVDLIGRLGLAASVDVFTLDTGLLFPETYDLWRRLEAHAGLTIRAVEPLLTVVEQHAAHGDALWSRDADACCRMRKVEPLALAVRGLDAWITAIRRDQTPERANARVVERDPRTGLVKINPLVRYTSKDVWRHVQAHDVPYNPLHDQGYPSIGCHPCTSPVAEGEDPRAGRWRGQGKRECGLHLAPEKEQTR